MQSCAQQSTKHVKGNKTVLCRQNCGSFQNKRHCTKDTDLSSKTCMHNNVTFGLKMKRGAQTTSVGFWARTVRREGAHCTALYLLRTAASRAACRRRNPVCSSSSRASRTATPGARTRRGRRPRRSGGRCRASRANRRAVARTTSTWSSTPASRSGPWSRTRPAAAAPSGVETVGRSGVRVPTTPRVVCRT